MLALLDPGNRRPGMAGGRMIAIERDAPDGRRLREAYGCFPSGVAAVCALVEGAPCGMAVSSFASVSVAPPLVSICMKGTSTTWPRLRGQPRLGLSILAEDQDGACRKLSGNVGDRFGGVRWHATDDGALFVHGSVAWFDCSVFALLAAGDHVIALLEVRSLWSGKASAPLVFHGSRFRRLAPEREPTCCRDF